ncbi:hypothetical protein SAMN05518801_101197 [Novosphingobium sp. CF614]|uniref:DUF2059 domain-containing protein n=1 Tax=Novosphingobium sp. CF614 TaxID=1884364 RepID=UPI0008E5992D|nr:DUF2059 domain-containing protein [Novosphingobium sp. CF614]SFF74738.1 hypothetical protein SAMN05518801_101197 [Novosphingobium sp. CF614]
MPKFLAALIAPALLLTAAPALAAQAPGETEAATETSIDPARLASARQTVDYVFPLGTYARIMNGTMDKIMDSMMDSMSKMPLKDLAGLSGVDTQKLGSASLAEIMEIYDPAYKERLKVTTHTMMAEMIGLMTDFEPEIRDGLAKAYAAKFDAKQLGELNAFFATPTGKSYAADSYIIMMSPEVMEKMQAFMPRMMQQMPAIGEKVKAATAALPAPRKYADLGKAEKAKLAKLLGLAEAELEKQEAAKAKQAD